MHDVIEKLDGIKKRLTIASYSYPLIVSRKFCGQLTFLDV